jgi:hypothetical protein
VTAAPGIVTASSPPNAAVEIQPGMNVQPVVLVDSSGAFVAFEDSVLTTLGDTLYEDATPAPARLAGNTSATKKFYTQAGTGSASAAPAWGTIAAGDLPGSFLCTPSQYAPASPASLTVTGTTFAAFSSLNVNTGSFTAPASGSVIVTAMFVAELTATAYGNVALAAHGTVTPLVSNVITWNDLSSLNGRPVSCTLLVTGLTPGTSYNLDLVGASGTVSDVVTIVAYGSTSTTGATTSAAPVVMTVQAV